MLRSKSVIILSIIFLTLAGFILVGQSLLFLWLTGQQTTANASIYVYAPKGVIKALIADNAADREQGLSGRTALPADTGMLFYFDTPGWYSFWMKDMHFPLDIIWINSKKQTIGVTTNVEPGSYPATFFPPAPIQYVLEVNAGQAAKFGVGMNTQLTF